MLFQTQVSRQKVHMKLIINYEKNFSCKNEDEEFLRA